MECSEKQFLQKFVYKQIHNTIHKSSKKTTKFNNNCGIGKITSQWNKRQWQDDGTKRKLSIFNSNYTRTKQNNYQSLLKNKRNTIIHLW